MNRTLMLSVLVFVCLVSRLSAQEAPTAEPATVSEARKVIDLSTFPLIEPIDKPNSAIVAMQSYRSKSNVEGATLKIQEKLQDLGFKPLEGGMVTEAYSSMNFAGKGFTLSLTVTAGSEPGTSEVTLQNLGNVAIDRLKLPAGMDVSYSGSGMTLFTTDKSAEQTRKECREALEQAGWQWFGDTQVSFFVRRNAVRLQVMASAPAVEGQKTFVQISSTQLSTEYPVPSALVMLQYSDSTGGLIMDSKTGVADMFSELRSLMESTGWKCTTETPIRIDFNEHLIFRGPEKEMLDFEVFEFEGLTRVRVKYYTAAQLEKNDGESSD